jgi:hypothetical protein
LHGDIKFTNPNIFNQKIQAVSTNSNYLRKQVESMLLPHLKTSIYSPYLYHNIYSPLAPKAKKYYKYKLDSQWSHSGITFYRLSFKPLIPCNKLVEGYLIVTDVNWNIRSLFIKGKQELYEFSNYIEMGDLNTTSELLPIKFDVVIDSKMLWNNVIGSYSAVYKYSSIAKCTIKSMRKRDNYDLSLNYNINIDSCKLISHKEFDSIRPINLSERETKILEKIDTITITKTPRKKSTIEQVSQFLVRDISLNFNEYGNLKFSPIISPVLLNYSSRNGISYSQKLHYKRNFKNDKLLSIKPRAGYNFKYKEFYWNVETVFDYASKRMGSFTFDIGDGHKIETSRVIKHLYSLPDNIFDTTKLNLQKFRTSFVKLGHSIEVVNGLTLSVSLAAQNYREIKKSKLDSVSVPILSVDMAREIARHSYTNFVPEISITYTPKQYFYMNGYRKIYLYSNYPTFNLKWAYAIKGVFNSTTKYNRVEFDMQHKINLGPTHLLAYRFGVGAFINYTDLYFADFVNFKRNNHPDGWDDEIGGVFHLLNRNQYNEINQYIRGHVKFDAPFLLVPTLFRRVKYITKERLYLNMLLTKNMSPFVELGYGLGTNYFNVGLFWGGEITKMNQFGVKFTFEAF